MFGHEGQQQPKPSSPHGGSYGNSMSQSVAAAAAHAPAKPTSVFAAGQPAHDDAQLDDPQSQPAQPSHDLTADDLLAMKQHALQQLSPLVSHLEQSPEEKFRTTMMMIQASDDQSLLETAYHAAQAIKDEKAKAQALLDVVNEINYFTQHHNQ